MTSKRALLAGVSDSIGLTRLLGLLPHRATLIVLNYHRIGDPASSPHYRGLFSATANEFDAQVAWLKAHFRVVTLDEAIALVDTPPRKWGARPPVLITFDDGYRDNYDVALPILNAHRVPATFFLATAFIGTGRVPWWDAVAYAVHTTAQARLRLTIPHTIDARLDDNDRTATVETLLRLFKSPANTDPPALLRAIQDALEVAAPDAPELFMGWDDAAAMVGAGMSIGSHTHSHEILARLPPDRQEDELGTSRRMIEDRLGIRVDGFAYPEGSRDSFALDTQAALARTGYRVAFSYYGGVNPAGRIARYDIRRMPVTADLTPPLFRLRATLAAACGAALI